jgi:hypothetical protein
MAPSQTSDAAQHRCQSNAYAYASGPKLPLVGLSDAAPQLRQTGHSCIVQHVLGPNDRNADFAVFVQFRVANGTRLPVMILIGRPAFGRPSWNSFSAGRRSDAFATMAQEQVFFANTYEQPGTGLAQAAVRYRLTSLDSILRQYVKRSRRPRFQGGVPGGSHYRVESDHSEVHYAISYLDPSACYFGWQSGSRIYDRFSINFDGPSGEP